MSTPALPALVVAVAIAACQPTLARRGAVPGVGATTPCATLAQTWRDHDLGAAGRVAYLRSARAFVARSLACGDPELAFTGFMLGPSCGGARCVAPDGSHLAAVERSGVPLRAAVAAWLASRDLGPLGATAAYQLHEPRRSLEELARWLAGAGYREFAQPLAAVATAQHDPDVQAALLEYFVQLGLPEGEPLARALLGQPAPGLRLAACVALDRLGSRAALPAVRAVAAHDPLSRLVVLDGVEQEVYPIREACAATAAALAARAAGTALAETR